jgi:cold shock CspA family protein
MRRLQTPLEMISRVYANTTRRLRSGACETHEKRFGRISSGRIVAIGWRHHERESLRDQYPAQTADGKEVDASRTPHADERHSDFDFALNDAFKRARRQLQDKVGRLQGKVKLHEPQTTGIVTKLFDDHGFLQTQAGVEIYFHRNSVLNGNFANLKAGTQVTFVEEQGENGPQASTIKL